MEMVACAGGFPGRHKCPDVLHERSLDGAIGVPDSLPVEAPAEGELCSALLLLPQRARSTAAKGGALVSRRWAGPAAGAGPGGGGGAADARRGGGQRAVQGGQVPRPKRPGLLRRYRGPEDEGAAAAVTRPVRQEADLRWGKGWIFMGTSPEVRARERERERNQW